jgi:cysteine-rich repeat protein
MQLKIRSFTFLAATVLIGCGDDGGSSGAVCGNENVEDVEQCDDGNRTDGDGCAADCRTENGVCGNRIEEADEECDDGNTAGGDGCNAQCQSEATAESEPNDDTQVASQTNDFSSANAQGPYSTDTLIKAAISPSGDDDCFAVTG